MGYVPILRGLQGEFIALSETSTRVQEEIRPVLEVVLEGQQRGTVQRFFDQARLYLPAGVVITLDCGTLRHLGPVGTGFGGGGLAWLSEGLDQFKQPVIPVVRPTDPPAVLIEAMQAQTLHRHGACLRVALGDQPRGSGSGLLQHRVQAVLEAVRLAPEEVDLLLDARYVADARAVAQALPEMLGLLSWSHRMPWRRISLAAGSFPWTVPTRATYRPQRLHRWEVSLWHQLTHAAAGTLPTFADYGVTHPVHPAGPSYRGRANLRYTTDDEWQVLVARTRENHESFALCRTLTASEFWPPRALPTPWGDRQIAARATNYPTGPGGPREWRAWTTSHHLAAVSERIRAEGTP